MPPALGKRKRISRKELEQPSPSPSPPPPPSSDSAQSGEEDVQAVFRRAFEAKFKPLAVEPKKARRATSRRPSEIEEAHFDDPDDAEWTGISESEDNVQVVDYTTARLGRDDTSRAEMKAFMSSKPPTSTAAPKQPLTAKKRPDDVDPAESTNLRNDLDLQKLLRESHLLAASSSGTATPMLSATGIARHKSTDLHLQSLGAKGSVFSQKKMPMAQRKHMIQKARLTDEKRRAEAKEAGIILERPTMNKIPSRRDETRKRDKAVGLPSVGKFRGGTLSLSKRDVRSITGGGGGGAKGKGKGNKAKR